MSTWNNHARRSFCDVERVTELRIVTTPDRLRAIAARLEEDWKKSTLGDWLPEVAVMDYEGGNRIVFTINQSECPKET